MNQKKVQALLDELCVVLGFCLTPQARARLKEDAPVDVDSFTEAVFRAEGLEAGGNRRLSRQVRDIVLKHFRISEAD